MNNSYGPLYRAAVAVAFVLGSASACAGSAQSEHKPLPLTLSGSVGGMPEREAGVTDPRGKRAQSTAYGGAAAPKGAARQAPRAETSGPYAGMVRVRGGTFQKGREGGLFGLGGAEPVHRVRLGHVGLAVESEDELRTFARKLEDAGYPLHATIDHIVSRSVYVRDPDGNMVKLAYNLPREQWAHMDNRLAEDRPYDLSPDGGA